MSVNICPKCGQVSSESDFCSECGARIEVAGVGVPAAPAPAVAPTGVDACPACHTPRPSSSARFCEVCRYDFVNQAAGGPPTVAAAVPQPAPPAPVATAPGTTTTTPAPNGVRWDVVIAVDATLDTDPDPDLKAPEEPERRIPLDKAENLVGRRDPSQLIVPDVLPHDPSVSRRHAKLLLNADGSVAILDLESANGTFVNGEQILAGVPHPLAHGDSVTMGRWSRLRIEERGHP
jgi:hypothetical protein